MVGINSMPLSTDAANVTYKYWRGEIQG